MQRHVADAAFMTFISPTYYKKPPKAPTGAKPRRMQRHVACNLLGELRMC